MVIRTPFYESRRSPGDIDEGITAGSDANIDDYLEKECRQRVYARIRAYDGSLIFPSSRFGAADRGSAETKDVVRRFLNPDQKRRLSAIEFLDNFSSWGGSLNR